MRSTIYIVFFSIFIFSYRLWALDVNNKAFTNTRIVDGQVYEYTIVKISSDTLEFVADILQEKMYSKKYGDKSRSLAYRDSQLSLLQKDVEDFIKKETAKVSDRYKDYTEVYPVLSEEAWVSILDKKKSHLVRVYNMWVEDSVKYNLSSNTVNKRYIKDFLGKKYDKKKNYIVEIEILKKNNLNYRYSKSELNNRNLSVEGINSNINIKSLSIDNKFSLLPQEEVFVTTNKDVLTQKYIERRIFNKGEFLKGKVAMGPISLDVLNFFSNNNFEGFRFQLGLNTNDRFSKRWIFSTYGALATDDKELKGGGGIKYKINNYSNIQVLGYSDVAAAGRDYANRDDLMPYYFLWGGLPNISNDKFYRDRHLELRYSKKQSSKFGYTLSTSYQRQKAKFMYSYKDYNSNDWFENMLIGTSIGYGIVEKEKNILNIKADYFQSIKGVGGFKYSQIDLFLNYKNENKLGESYLKIRGGMMLGDAPLWNLYEAGGTAKDNTRGIGLASSNVFETMVPGRFFSDKYVSIMFAHNIKPLRLFGNKYLYPLVTYRGILGSISNKENHKLYKFNNLNHYYQEVGLELNRLILNRIGVGSYLRIGAYQETKFTDNLFFKVTVDLF